MAPIKKSVATSIQINQLTRCNSFTSLLLDVFVWLNKFRAPLRPSSGAYNCTRSFCLDRWSVAVGAWRLERCWSWSRDHDQQPSNRHAPTVKPEAPSAVVAPDDGRRGAQNIFSHTQTSSNKLVKFSHLVGWFIWIAWWCTDLRTSNSSDLLWSQ